MDHLAGNMLNRFPLPPYEAASLECLLYRLQPIYDRLLKQRFSDAAASQAVDVALRVGCKALSSGKAARMTAETRAGWLWKVAFNAARRAAATELKVVSLMVDPVERLFKSNYDQEVLETLRRAIDSLPLKQMQAIELHGLQELSLREAARLIGVSPSTVANRYNAGLRRLGTEVKAASQVGQTNKLFALLGARAC